LVKIRDQFTFHNDQNLWRV